MRGTAASSRARPAAHERAVHAGGPARALAMYRRLDRPRRQGELLKRDARASAGRRAQRRLTMWDWADPKVYLHDAISTDKRTRRSTPTGPIYGALRGERRLLPRDRSEDEHGEHDQARARDPDTPSSAEQPPPPGRTVSVLGRRGDLGQQTTVHSFRDGQAGTRLGRGRIRSRRRRPVPGRIGSPSAKLLPIAQGLRGLIMTTRRPRRHDDRHVLYVGPLELRRQRRDLVVVRARRRRGLFDVKTWDKTHDEKARPQGWSAFVIDNNGNGKARRLHGAEPAGRSDQDVRVASPVLWR